MSTFGFALLRCLLVNKSRKSHKKSKGAVVSTDWAAFMLLVHKPVFNTLGAENMVPGASDLPNLHFKV
jgi:hypothetical protein